MTANDPKILVPVDFEAGSLRALGMAQELARLKSAQIVLVHVYSSPVYAYGDMPAELLARLDIDLRDAAKRTLAKLAEENGGVPSVFRHGDPATEILELAAELRPVMIVMGTHGRRGLRRVFLGSVAEKVVRRSTVPVLTVPGAEDRGGQ